MAQPGMAHLIRQTTKAERWADEAKEQFLQAQASEASGSPDRAFDLYQKARKIALMVLELQGPVSPLKGNKSDELYARMNKAKEEAQWCADQLQMFSELGAG